MYRDCNGIPANPTPQVNIRTVSCSNVLSAFVTMTRISISPISFLCPGTNNICTGGSYPYGIEEQIFEKTVRLDSALFGAAVDPSCCQYRISYQECCRNGSITNITPGNFYVDAILNRCLGTNHSPRFRNMPLVAICSGQGIWYNNGAVDSLDNDSITVTLSPPLNGASSPETFNTGYSYTVPFAFLGYPNTSLPFPAGITMDSITGDVGFTPTGSQQSVLVFKFTEWRKVNGTYQIIGTTYRDVNFFGASCATNNPPEMEVNGSKTGQWIINACPGSQTCFTVRGRDKDTTGTTKDTTLITVINRPATSSFYSANASSLTLREDSAVICWTPTNQQVSDLPYSFILKVRDTKCPVPGYSIRTVRMLVKNFTPQGSIKDSVLSTFSRKLSFVKNDTNTFNYSWVISATNNGVFTATGGSTYNTQSFNHTFSQTGAYVVRLIAAQGSCSNTFWDTIRVCTFSIDAGNNLTSCQNVFASLNTTVQNATGKVKYNWYKLEGANMIMLPDSTNAFQVADTNKFNNYNKRFITYIVTVADSMKCNAFDSVFVTIHKPVSFLSVNHSPAICNGQSLSFGFTPSIADSMITYSWNNTKTTPFITQSDSGVYRITALNPDSSCSTTDSISLSVKAVPNANLGPDQYNCAGKLITLAGVNGATNIWYRNSLTLATPNVAPTVTTTYRLQSYFTYGSLVCTDWDTMVVIVGNKATVTINPPGYKCTYDNAVPLTLTQTSLPAGTGVWTSSLPSCISSNIFNAYCAGNGIHKIYFTFTTDTFGCVSKDSTTINVGTPTPVTLTHAPNYCLSQGTASFTALPQSGGNGYWYSPAGNCFSGNVFYLSCAGPGTHKYFYTFYTLPHGCMSQDSATFTIVANPLSMFNANPLSGTAPLTVNFYDNTTGQPGLYEWLFSNPFVGFNYSSYVQNPVYTFTNAGVYNVRLTTRKTQAGITCSDSITAPAFITVNPNASGIKTALGNEAVHIYPNPTQHHFTIQCTQPGKYLIEMVDYTGKIILKETFKGKESVLDISSLANGIYLVVITSENNERTTIKLVKE